LGQVGQALALEELELLDDFLEQAFFEQSVDQLLVLLFGVEASKDFHLVYDLALFLGLFPLKFLDLLQIKESTLDDKLLATDSLIKSRVVKLDNVVLQFEVLWSVVIEELHVGEEQLSIHIVLLLEVSTFGQVAQYLVAILLLNSSA